MNAKIESNLIPVVASERDGRKYLAIDLADGWDTCKRICKKVLTFNNEHYVFTGWSSDTNQAYFRNQMDVAKIN